MSNLSSGQKDELMDQVRQQIAVANAQELLTVSARITSNQCISQFAYVVSELSL